MDRSFQSPIFSGRSSRLSTGSPFLPGARKPLSNIKKSSVSSRYSVSGRSNQTLQIIAKSDYNVVKTYGLPLPVLVNEALTFSDRNVLVSMNSSAKNGWAWVVCGRRLLVWQYRESKFGSPRSDGSRPVQRRGIAGQCRELTLPHCDIGHKASLITVFVNEGQQMASCLAVSPTGDIRYWPSVAHDGSSIDETISLEGQEFDELLSISPIGYVVATTTCDLVLLQLQVSGGRQTITNRAIKAPSGFLGGIGRKFASIIIGMHNQDRENKLLRMCAEPSGGREWTVSVMSERWIQRWSFQMTDGECFIFEDSDFLRRIRESFHKKFWVNRDPNEVEIWLLDLQTSDSDLVVLAAGMNKSFTPQLHYALITFNCSENQDHLVLSNFHQLTYNTFHSEEHESDLLAMKFVLNKNYAYVYSEKTIFPVLLNEPAERSEEVERLDFLVQGDKLMAASMCQGCPIFFSRVYGLVCVSPADFEPGDFFNASMTSDALQSSQILSDSGYLQQTIVGNLTLYDLDPEIISSNSDMISQLKSAFIYQLKRNSVACFAILKELFPPDVVTPEIDAPMDVSILKIAQDLADDKPAADPRWEQSDLDFSRHSLGSSTSLQIVQQLREKNFALNHFVEFLHSSKLWERLRSISSRGTTKATTHLLSDINEKIIVAISLKNAQGNHSVVMDNAMKMVLEQRQEVPCGNLTHQDVFYVKVTKIQDIFHAMSDQMENFIVSEDFLAENKSMIVEINSVVLTAIGEIIKFRDAKGSLFALPEAQARLHENLPWTTMGGKNGIRDALMKMINSTLKYGARGTGEPELRQKYYQQLMELTDFVLDGRRNFLESSRRKEQYSILLQQYESQRSDLIYPFVEDEQFELAAKLAEKYMDFQILVAICDRTRNQAKLEEYIERFKDMEFSQFAINWHLRQNKQQDLFDRFKNNQAALGRFLHDHPSLAWVQFVFNGELMKAAEILFVLAQNETELVARKKTNLSLAKLSFFAAGDSADQIEMINNELNLIEYQEQLPIEVLQAFGFDTDNPKVLKPEEIINLYISEENEGATEYDFRKALEMLQFVEDNQTVRHKIWCAAILRDSWTNYDMNDPLNDMQDMMFFKLIDCCHLRDENLEDVLPSIREFLHSPELGPLTDNKSFQYLLQFGYEHINRAYKKSDM
ncbi:nuclear pore complex protein Nup133 [Phlebotomus argentipes]|uniref:nuclear pore complex protein Nup133 n=1 Tax=Phlebotomus argentipes TaxID=94469 RepID=UPI002892B1FE|nr:nuclear pore complex protein Nup133 [Phlebotomus argentipes]